MTETTSDTIMSLEISPFRRFFGVGVLAALAITLIYAGANSLSGSIGGIVGLLLFAAAAFYAGWKLYHATDDTLFLTPEGVFTRDGQVIVSLDNIASVDRGFFAFKPSNGFLVRLKTPMARGWAPGLWWRFGRRVGIGGATTPGQGKAMADMILVLTGPQRDIMLEQLDQK